MPITRAKATSLLNQREMALFDDSRANALRALDQKALQTRIGRARTARDRARDLLQRQKLGSRAATGSKRGTTGNDNARSKDKVELMTDILARFEGQLAKCQASADSPASRSASKTATAGKSTTAATRPAGKSAAKAPAKTARKATTKRSKLPPGSGSLLVKPNRTRQRAAL